MDRGKKAQKPHQPTHKLNQEIISNRWPKELEFLPEDTTTNPTRKMIVQNKRISGGLVAINAARTCQNPSNLHRIAPLLRVPKFRAELAVGIVGNRREPPGMAGKNRAPPGTAGNAREAPGTAGDRRGESSPAGDRWGPAGEAPGSAGENRAAPVPSWLQQARWNDGYWILGRTQGILEKWISVTRWTRCTRFGRWTELTRAPFEFERFQHKHVSIATNRRGRNKKESCLAARILNNPPHGRDLQHGKE